MPRTGPFLVVGVVGGIGSGKSAVCRWVAERHPEVRVIDADADGHRALMLAEVKAKLKESFGNEVIGADGEVDRRALAGRVFGDSAERQAAKTALEAIVHPAIAGLRDEQLQEFARDSAIRAVLVDAALLQEAGWQDQCDAVIYVDTPREVRLKRVENRGWSESELARREASQWPVERKRAASQFVVDNSQTLDNAGGQVYEYLQRLYASAVK
jgi:dephospho-CoA kinase